MKGEEDGSSSHSLAKFLLSNESIKANPVQIVVKDYLRFHQTKVRSV
jgi:hypothetical protein